MDPTVIFNIAPHLVTNRKILSAGAFGAFANSLKGSPPVVIAVGVELFEYNGTRTNNLIQGELRQSIHTLSQEVGKLRLETSNLRVDNDRLRSRVKQLEDACATRAPESNPTPMEEEDPLQKAEEEEQEIREEEAVITTPTTEVPTPPAQPPEIPPEIELKESSDLIKRYEEPPFDYAEDSVEYNIIVAELNQNSENIGLPLDREVTSFMIDKRHGDLYDIRLGSIMAVMYHELVRTLTLFDDAEMKIVGVKIRKKDLFLPDTIAKKLKIAAMFPGPATPMEKHLGENLLNPANFDNHQSNLSDLIFANELRERAFIRWRNIPENTKESLITHTKSVRAFLIAWQNFFSGYRNTEFSQNQFIDADKNEIAGLVKAITLDYALEWAFLCEIKTVTMLNAVIAFCTNLKWNGQLVLTWTPKPPKAVPEETKTTTKKKKRT